MNNTKYVVKFSFAGEEDPSNHIEYLDKESAINCYEKLNKVCQSVILTKHETMRCMCRLGNQDRGLKIYSK